MPTKYPKAEFTSPMIKKIYSELFVGYEDIFRPYLESMTTQLEIFVPCEAKMFVDKDDEKSATYEEGVCCPLISEERFSTFSNSMRKEKNYNESFEEVSTYSCEDRLYEIIDKNDFEISLGNTKSYQKKTKETQTEFKINVFDNHSFKSPISREYIMHKGNRTKLEKVTRFKNTVLETEVKMVDKTTYKLNGDSVRHLNIFIQICDKKQFAELLLGGADGVYKRLNEVVSEYGEIFKLLMTQKKEE
eukprot:GAHX01001979.1.p1 GENE.GAHX01001979.1~~GAHX01001979.1.p1  ORF type:complete len:246 (+),score=56.59 GAHX01001979.1:80-817(+)